MKSIDKLKSDSLLRNDIKLYQFAVEAHAMAADAENTKLYLKQKADTIGLFKNSYDCIRNIMVVDSLESTSRPHKKKKYFESNQALLQRYFKFLHSAGRYYYTKKKYGNAIPFFSLYLELPHHNLWRGMADISSDSVYKENTYLYSKSCLLEQDYKNVYKYEALLMSDSVYKRSSIENFALAAEGKKDNLIYEDYLLLGIRLYPKHSFFYTRLLDFYNHNKEASKALALADTLLQADSCNLVILEGKCLALMNLQKYEEVIKVAQKILRISPETTNANYYVGASYCNLADKIASPSNINSQLFKRAEKKKKALYRTAQPYLEKFAEREPQKDKLWAPLLYKVYLSLEIENKFVEIDKLLKSK